MSDDPVRLCPACGERKIERLISAGAGIVFKGPGFYATDYRKPERGGATSGEGGGEAASGREAADGGGATAKPGGDGARGGEANKTGVGGRGGRASTEPARGRDGAS